MTHEKHINIVGLARLAWSYKMIIAFIVLFSSFCSLLISLSIPNRYLATAILAPADESSSVGVPTGLGGLASLAGVNFGSVNQSKSRHAIEVLKSRKFLFGFIKDNDLTVPLVAANGWDAQTRELTIDSKAFDVATGEWVDVKEASIQNAYSKFLDMLNVNYDESTGFVRISFRHFSPDLSQMIVDRLVGSLNEDMRLRDIKDAENSIEYLETQLNETSIADMKSIFFGLIEEQIKKILIAEVRKEYVFKVIDPAIVSEQKHSPNRAVIVAMGLVFGVVFSALLLIFIAISKE